MSTDKKMKNTVEEPKKSKTEYERDHEQVRGKFIFHEISGGSMNFGFKKHYGDNIETYHMKDGEIYEIPRMVAEHLNKNCWYPSYSYNNDEQGRPVTTLKEKVRRCSFQSLEFVDEDNPSALHA